MEKNSDKKISMPSKSEGADHDEHPTSSSASLVNIDNFVQEELLSRNFSSKELYQEFLKGIMSFQEVLATVSEKRFNSEKHKEDNEITFVEPTEELICQISSIGCRLKKINRLDKHRLKNSRDRVAECKQEVDEKSLKYQNMLSEMAYLTKETESCLEFNQICRSDLSTIDLIPVEEFYREAPSEMTNGETTEGDTHELTLARLKWELEKRKLLAKELKETEEKKKQIELKVKSLTDSLHSMKPMLEKLLEAAAAPLEAIGVPPFQEYYSGFKDAKHLPLPLRKIFTYLRGYAEVYDDGNFEIHANVVPTEIPRPVTHYGPSDYGFDVNETQVHQSNKEGNNPPPKAHHLSVQCIIIYEGSTLVLAFSYVTCLNIVSVKMQKLIPNPSLSLPVNKLLMADGFLDNLFPGDNGKKIPSCDIQQLFHGLGIAYLDSLFSYSIGKPYIWAQKFSGVKFGSKSDPLSLRNLEQDMSFGLCHAKYINEVIVAIKSKMKSRISLTSEISMLVSKSKPPTAVTSMLPINIASRLKSFEDACATDIYLYPGWKTLKEEKIFTDECFLYKLEIERGSASLSSLIIVPPDYPLNAPVFLLFLQWKGAFNNMNSIEIRELEQEINVFLVEDIPEEHKEYTLLCQVHYLRACFDVYLETHPFNDVIEGPKEFASDTIIVGMFRGRSHSRPYKYVPSLRHFTFR